MPNATLRSSRDRNGTNQIGIGIAGAAITKDATLSVPSGSAATYEIVFCRVPTNARVHYTSVVSWDDLASSGSPTLDLGFKAVNGNFTTDVDALNDGLDLATATNGARVIKDHANSGRMVWEFIAGLTSDPGGFADYIGTVLDAGTNITGDVSSTLVFTVE